MRANFWSGLTVFAVSILAIFLVIPGFVGPGFGGSVSPKFMPTVGASIMTAASAAVWIGALRALVRSGEGVLAPVEVGSLLRQLWPFAFVALAIALISWVGLIYSGPFVIAALLLILGERNPAILVPASVIPPALIWVLATQLMRVGMV